MAGAFQGSAFQNSAYQTGVAVTAAVGHVGKRGQAKRGTRHRWLIEGRLLLLTEDELRAYLLRLLRRRKQEREQAPVPQKAKPVLPIAVEPIAAADFGLLAPQMQTQPTYVQVAADLARERWAQSQPQILRVLRDLADGLEADAIQAAEDDDEDILLLT